VHFFIYGVAMEFYKVKSEREARDLIKRLPDEVSLDIETTGLNPFTDTVSSAALAISPSSALIFTPQALPALVGLGTTSLILHNSKFDLRFLYRAGINLLSAKVIDTILLHHLIDENQEHSLDYLVKQYFNDNYKEEFWAKYKNYNDAPEIEQIEYVGKDVIYTKRLKDILLPQCKPELVTHVHKLNHALLQTECHGVNIDLPYITQYAAKIEKDIEMLKVNMRGQVEHYCTAWELKEWSKELEKRKTPRGKNAVERPRFNFESTKQLGELLYDTLGLPEQKNKAGNRTVDDAALANIETKHAVIPVIREFRDKQKISGTYVQGILERQHEGVIYPEFNVNGTVTGRISHKNPNMGNMPRDNEIRGFFVPRPGHKLITADYAQLEICLAAHFSQDKTLLELVHSGESMHDKTCEALREFNIPRTQCKNINFGIIYGAQEYRISAMIGCNLEFAKAIIEKFWQTYPGLQRIINQCHEAVDNGQPIVNPFGRARHFGTSFSNYWDRERAKRQAFNALIQGTGGDITSRAFYLIGDFLSLRSYGRGLFTVHDEVVIESLSDYCNVARDALISYMEGVGKELDLLVPLTVTASAPLTRWQK
jgi:DNA polymerase-1